VFEEENETYEDRVASKVVPSENEAKTASGTLSPAESRRRGDDGLESEIAGSGRSTLTSTGADEATAPAVVFPTAVRL